MKSRDAILSRLQTKAPSGKEGGIKLNFSSSANPLEEFTKSLEKVGGNLVSIHSNGNWNTWIAETLRQDLKVYSEVEMVSGNFAIDEDMGKSQMNTIDVAVLQGEFGIAENGAVWVEKFMHRAIPFIAQQLVLILKQDNIISTLNEAYSELSEFGLPDFGVFISGPSKTADIEQSLVYGAHGPKALTVVLV